MSLSRASATVAAQNGAGSTSQKGILNTGRSNNITRKSSLLFNVKTIQAAEIIGSQVSDGEDFLSKLEKYRLDFKKMMANSMIGEVFENIVIFVSIISMIEYIYYSYEVNLDDDAQQLDILQNLELAFVALFGVDWLVNVLTATNPSSYVLTMPSIIDILIMISTFAAVNTNFTPYVELDHADATASVLYVLYMCRTLRVLRPYVVVKKFANIEDPVQHFLAERSVYATVAIIFFAALMQFIEMNGQPYPFHIWIYYIWVTVGTVGYGDIYPMSTIGRFFAMTIIAFSIIMIPTSTNQLLTMMKLQSAYARASYLPKTKNGKHVIICGDLSSISLIEFFDELYHEDHEVKDLSSVLLFPLPPAYDIIFSLLQNPKYFLSLTYLQGSALQESDLRRAKAETANAIFILTNKFSADPDQEDAKSILINLSIKRYLSYFDRSQSMHYCMQLIRPENKKHLQSTAQKQQMLLHYQQALEQGNHSSNNSSSARAAMLALLNEESDLIVCLNDFKLGLMAKSVLYPGTTNLLANLLSSFSEDDVLFVDDEENDQVDGSMLPDGSLKQGQAAASASSSAAASAGESKPFARHSGGSGVGGSGLGLVGLGLASLGRANSSARKSNLQRPTSPNSNSRSNGSNSNLPLDGSNGNNNGDAAIEAANRNRTNNKAWIKEYGKGCGWEIYLTPISSIFTGAKFSELSWTLYDKKGVVLFALQITDLENPTMGSRVFLNPANFIIPDPTKYTIEAFVIAQNHQAADLTMSKVTQQQQQGGGGFGGGGAAGGGGSSASGGSSPTAAGLAAGLAGFAGGGSISGNSGGGAGGGGSSSAVGGSGGGAAGGTNAGADQYKRRSSVVARKITKPRIGVQTLNSGGLGSIQEKSSSSKRGGKDGGAANGNAAANGNQQQQGQSKWSLLKRSALVKKKVETCSYQEVLTKLEDEHLKKHYYVREHATTTTGAVIPLAHCTIRTNLLDELPYVNKHCIIMGKLSKSLYDLIRPLRSKHLGILRYIVILHPNEIPLEVWQRISIFEGIAFVRGSPLHDDNLRRAGIFRAAQVVLLSDAGGGGVAGGEAGQGGSSGTASSDHSGSIDALVDSEAIFVYQQVKRLNPAVHIVVEIVKSSNIGYLDDDNTYDSQVSDYKFSSQFASGLVFTSAVLDTIICQTYYNPHILKVVNKLLSGVDEMDEYELSTRARRTVQMHELGLTEEEVEAAMQSSSSSSSDSSSSDDDDSDNEDEEEDSDDDNRKKKNKQRRASSAKQLAKQQRQQEKDKKTKEKEVKRKKRESILANAAQMMSLKRTRSIIHNIQGSYLYQIELPANLGEKKYGVLYRYLTQHGMVPLGIYRGTFQDIKIGPQANHLPYLYTNPDKDTELFSCDKIFVLFTTPVKETSITKTKNVKDWILDIQMQKSMAHLVVDPNQAAGGGVSVGGSNGAGAAAIGSGSAAGSGGGSVAGSGSIAVGNSSVISVQGVPATTLSGLTTADLERLEKSQRRLDRRMDHVMKDLTSKIDVLATMMETMLDLPPSSTNAAIVPQQQPSYSGATAANPPRRVSFHDQAAASQPAVLPPLSASSSSKQLSASSFAGGDDKEDEEAEQPAAATVAMARQHRPLSPVKRREEVLLSTSSSSNAAGSGGAVQQSTIMDSERLAMLKKSFHANNNDDNASIDGSGSSVVTAEGEQGGAGAVSNKTVRGGSFALDDSPNDSPLTILGGQEDSKGNSQNEGEVIVVKQQPPPSQAAQPQPQPSMKGPSLDLVMNQSSLRAQVFAPSTSSLRLQPPTNLSLPAAAIGGDAAAIMGLSGKNNKENKLHK